MPGGGGARKSGPTMRQPVSMVKATALDDKPATRGNAANSAKAFRFIVARKRIVTRGSICRFQQLACQDKLQ
jgi:hypothetical protein